MSAKAITGVPRWKEQLDAALEKEDLGAAIQFEYPISKY